MQVSMRTTVVSLVSVVIADAQDSVPGSSADRIAPAVRWPARSRRNSSPSSGSSPPRPLPLTIDATDSSASGRGKIWGGSGSVPGVVTPRARQQQRGANRMGEPRVHGQVVRGLNRLQRVSTGRLCPHRMASARLETTQPSMPLSLTRSYRPRRRAVDEHLHVMGTAAVPAASAWDLVVERSVRASPKRRRRRGVDGAPPDVRNAGHQRLPAPDRAITTLTSSSVMPAPN